MTDGALSQRFFNKKCENVISDFGGKRGGKVGNGVSPRESALLAGTERVLPKSPPWIQSSWHQEFHQLTSKPGSHSQGQGPGASFSFFTLHFFCHPLCLKSLSAAVNLPRETREAQISCIEVVRGLGFLTLGNGSRGMEQTQRWVSLERLKIQLR